MITAPWLWKEWRESAWGFIGGGLWVMGALLMVAKAYDLPLHIAIEMIGFAVTAFVPAVTVLMLAGGRFAIERHFGTWSFARTLPVPIRRLVAVKWSVALGLGMAFMAVSSGIAWFPIRAMEPLLGETPWLPWVLYHVALVSVMMAGLLLIDTIDWGDRLGTRALITGVFLVLFLVRLTAHGPSTALIAGCFAGTAAAALLAIAAAPWLTREGLIPSGSRSRWGRRRGFRGAMAAWRWHEWRRAAVVFWPILLWMPALLAFIVLIDLRAGSFEAWRESAMSACESLSRAVPLAVVITGAMLGCMTATLEGHEATVIVGRTLPLSRRGASLSRAAVALELHAAAILFPLSVLFVARHAGAGDAVGAALAEALLVGLIGTAVLALVHLISALSFAAGGLATIPLAVLAVNVDLLRDPGAALLPWLLAGLVALTAAAILAAPHLLWRAEVR